MAHLYDLNPHLKPKPKEKAPTTVKKGRPKKAKDEQANNDKSKS